MATMNTRAIKSICLSEYLPAPDRCTTTSFVKIVPKQRNCESSEDMIAAKTPAVSKPVNTGSPTNRFSIAERTAGGGTPGGKTPLAQAPTNTQGTHTIIMQSGCAMTVKRKDFALLAVNQC